MFSFKKFELDESEAELLADQGDQIAIEFIPEIGNRYAKLLMFLTSLIAVFGKKYLEYYLSIDNKKVKEEHKKENKVYNEEGIEVIQNK